MRRYSKVILLVILGLGAIFVSTILWKPDLLFIFIAPIRYLSAAEQMSKIKSDTTLTFPTDARVEHFLESLMFVEPVWVAKVIIPTSYFENLKQDLLARPDQQSNDNHPVADSTSWWKPSNIILTKQYILSDSWTLVRVIVSKENEELAVYIECTVL